jgi:hypothetical protein
VIQTTENDRLEWRIIPGYPHYQISCHGEIRSLPHIVPCKGAGTRLSPGRRIKPQAGRAGYPTVSLSHEGKIRQFYIHILATLTFHGPKPSPLHEVAHYDGVKTNNRCDNLRWATRTENFQDRDRHGNTARGAKNWNSTLDEEKVRLIRRLRSDGELASVICRQFGISIGSVYNIENRLTWGHVT